MRTCSPSRCWCAGCSSTRCMRPIAGLAPMLQDLIGGQIGRRLRGAAGGRAARAGRPAARAGGHGRAPQRRVARRADAARAGLRQPVFRLRQWAAFWRRPPPRQPALARLEHELIAALDDAAVRQALLLAGFEIERVLGAADAAATLRADLALVPPLIRELGVHAAVRLAMRQRRSARVVVIGASIAGLLAARVLARSCPRGGADRARPHRRAAVRPRKGVPQAHHAHALLDQRPARDRSRCARAGTVAARARRAVRQRQLLHRRRLSARAQRATPACTRAARCSRRNARSVFAHSRRCACSMAGRPTCRNSSAAASSACARVRSTAAHARDLAADLVVDASGRGSRTGGLAGQRGLCGAHASSGSRSACAMPRGSCGARRRSRRPPVLQRVAVAGQPRACGVLAQEGGRWIVTLIGYFGDQPPLDDAGFLAFARSLPAPEVGELLQRAAAARPDPHHSPLPPTSARATSA